MSERKTCIRCGDREAAVPIGGIGITVEIDATGLCTWSIGSNVGGCLPAFRGWVDWRALTSDEAVAVKVDQFLAERPKLQT